VIDTGLFWGGAACDWKVAFNRHSDFFQCLNTSGSTDRNSFRDLLNCPGPEYFSRSDRLGTCMPNRDPDIVQFCGDTAKTTVKCIKKSNVGDRLRGWTRVVSRAWYSRGKKINARRRQSVWTDFCETFWVVDDFGAWPSDRPADPIPHDQTIDALIS